MTDPQKLDEFVDRASQLFVEMFGNKPESEQFIIFAFGHAKEGADSCVMGGNGCPICAVENLNTFVVMNDIRHLKEDAEVASSNGSQMN